MLSRMNCPPPRAANARTRAPVPHPGYAADRDAMPAAMISRPAAPGRSGATERDHQAGNGEQAAGDGERRPAITFGDGRDRHRDDRDQHARISRLAGPIGADDPVIEPEGERRGDHAEIEELEPVIEARLEDRRAVRPRPARRRPGRRRASPSRASRAIERAFTAGHELHDIGGRGGEHARPG